MAFGGQGVDALNQAVAIRLSNQADAIAVLLMVLLIGSSRDRIAQCTSDRELPSHRLVMTSLRGSGRRLPRIARRQSGELRAVLSAGLTRPPGLAS